MMTSFKVFFEEELTVLLATRLTATAQDILESKLMLSQKSDQKNYTKLCLLQNPIFDTHYVAFILDDEFGMTSEPESFWGYDPKPLDSYQVMPLLLIDKA